MRVLSCLTFFVLILIGGVVYFVFQIEKSNDNPFGDKEFVVETGSSISEITTRLENEGFIKKPRFFRLYAMLKGKEEEFKAGTFKLRTDMSIADLVTELSKEKAAKKEVKITTLEGWTNQEIAQYLESKNLGKADDFLSYLKLGPKSSYEFLIDKPASADLEGYLYPDTYMVFEDATPNVMVTKMLDNFDLKLTNEMREEISKQGKSIFEVLTLASIVEKEMFGYENRQIVASIFLNRLADNYPLQSDATVNYITQKGTTRPSLDDTQLENPYNTYRNAGLPPGPICNPSIEAIKAVIYPKETDYYFFLTTKDGQIIYSRNHEEHILNRQKYLD